jgi:phospholipid/cholesterol/gamma-HCH transport system substrate-binding protein
MIAILAILGFFILKVEDVRIGPGEKTKEVEVLFDSVAGLDEKSAVRVAGVRKGKVKAIELRPEDQGKARVTLEIDEDVQLHRDAHATVASLGLLGEKYVELDPGSPSTPVVSDTTRLVIPGGESASIDQVTDQVSAIATDVKAITASLRNVLGGPEGERRVEEIVTNIQAVTARLRYLIEANEGNVNATAANLRQITADLRVEIPRIANSIDRLASTMSGTIGENREDVRVVVSNLKGLSADLRTTANNLNDITGQVKTGEGTVGKLIYSDEAHDRLTTALGSVESGVTELRTTLGRLGRISLDLGVRSEYYAGRGDEVGFGGNSRSAVTAMIIPNPERNRFYNVELTDDPRGEKDEKIIETVTVDGNGVESRTRTHEVKFQRDFLVSAQAGWRLDELDLRVGLFESSGGVGADYRLNERTTVTGEAFDFGKRYDDNPHLRLFGSYVFRKEKSRYPALFLTTGIDDPLNDTAFTIGGGIRWRDEDLKYLLGSIPLGR